jgi:uncharacterized protein (UPF0261 family)
VAERRVVAVIATLDTKGLEAGFLRDRLREQGYAVRVLDVGITGDAQCATGDEDVPAAAVAAAADTSLDALRTARRDHSMAAMGRGAAHVLGRWAAEGALAGAMGLGGNQGTAIACTALRSLPLGLPKVMVSTVASGNIRPYIGASDIAMVFSLADLLGGPNRITRMVLVRAAGMLHGMITASAAPEVRSGPADAAGSAHRPAVALTVLGNTHAAALRITDGLGARGFEVVPFHASGAGGAAMERLVDAGFFAGVVDLTPHELLGEICADDIYAPAEGRRLIAAGRQGLPQVVAPGGLDYFIFGPPESVPARFRGRPTHHHNPYNENVLAAAEERAQAGRLLAERLNAARGSAAVVYPLRGWSHIGREGGVMWDPAGAEAFRRSLRAVLRTDRVRYREIDANINDPVFADEVVRVFLELAAVATTETM